jgi:hypothetical protein
MKMADEIHSNDVLGLDDLPESVAALDAKIADASKDEMSDAEKEKLEALVAERNEAFKNSMSE